MTTVLCFAALSLFVALPFFLAVLHLNLWASLALTLLSFVLFQVLYVIFFRLVAGAVPLDRPIEKASRIGRFGTNTMISALDVYAGVHPVITGIEKLPTDRRFLFVCNHRSMFDPVVVMDKLQDYDIAFITKPSNLKIPLVGRVAYTVGFLPIDRENDRNALKTILTAADYIKKDICSIGIYPEGTRSKTGELLPFHSGSFKIAQKAKAPIVIASVHGSEKVRLWNPFVQAKVYLDILEVIPPDAVCATRTDALAAHARSLIQENLDRAKQEDE